MKSNLKQEDQSKEYRAYQFVISRGDSLFEYCDTMCFNSKNLYNVVNFYIRQVMTGIQKPKACLSQNEK